MTNDKKPMKAKPKVTTKAKSSPRQANPASAKGCRHTMKSGCAKLSGNDAELLVTCRHCGSRNIAIQRILRVETRAGCFSREKGSKSIAPSCSFGVDRLDSDTGLLEEAYRCLNCNREYTDGLMANVKVSKVPFGSVPWMFGFDGHQLRELTRHLVLALIDPARTPRAAVMQSLIDAAAFAVGWADGEDRSHLKKEWVVIVGDKRFPCLAENEDEARAMAAAAWPAEPVHSVTRAPLRIPQPRR